MPYRQLKQNDATTIPFQLTEANGKPTDLTGDTVYITVYFSGSDSQSAGTVATVDDVEVTSYVDRDQGRVEHEFDPDDFSYAGRYLIEFEVDDGTDSERYPKVQYYDIEVDNRLGVISPGELASTGSLSGNVDADGFDIMDGGRFEADVIVAGILEDRSSGSQIDIDSLTTGLPSVSDDGSQVSTGAPDINAGTDLEAINDGDNSVTLNVIGGGGGGSLAITDNDTTVSSVDEATFTGSGATTVDVTDNGNGIATVDVSSTDTNTDTHTDVSDDGSTVVADVSDINFGSNTSVSADGDGSVTVSATSGSTPSIEERRENAYRSGPTITIETSRAASASETGTDAEYGEASLPLRDGWRLELIEVGAGDENPSGSSEAQVWVSDDPNDDTTYTEVYSTLDTDEVSEDGNGNIDFTTTLYNHDNTSGGVERVFFRAVNNDTGSSTFAVWGNFTVVRRPIP